MDSQAPLQINAPSLPKGGGAIQSIGRGWRAVGATGTGSFQIQLPISPGRGHAPPLALGYTSGSGNGVCGLGWALSQARVARRSSHGVPAYQDDDEIVGPDGDVWMPERNADGEIVVEQFSTYRGLDLGTCYDVVRHFPRVESTFDRIERWRSSPHEAGFWLIHGADGSLHLYGKRSSARIADPAAPASRVAEWLLEESLTPHGEHILYEYQSEDERGLEHDSPGDHSAQRYLSRARYGNVEASDQLYLWDESSVPAHWHFDLLFDYGERTVDPAQTPQYEVEHDWSIRSDPFSSFAYGFELRTLRLCQQVLMFHHFPLELGEHPVLTQRLRLDYQATDLGYNHLVAAHLQASDAEGQLASRPPVTFSYTPFALEESRYHAFDSMPGLDDGQHYQLVDLYGEGVPGVLCRDARNWLYREPLRAADAPSGKEVTYGPWQALPTLPMADPGKPVQHMLSDLTGDGRLDWIIAQPGISGFFTLNQDRSWADFASFAAFPAEFLHAQGQLSDLMGGGLSDLSLIGPRSVRLYANRRTEGFAPGKDIGHVGDPLPVASDSANELVAFSDLLGTGQQHLVRIRHNEVRVWPNLGRGRFGNSRCLATLPFTYDKFDAGLIRLADLDGSGAADLIYLQPDHALIFMNRGGNGFNAPHVQPWPDGVKYDRLCQVSMADLQGLGCSSLVLSTLNPTPQHWRCDFLNDHKPYLLTETNNHMGAASTVEYRSSAQEWLDEKHEALAAGRPAVARLPFPVHVVARQSQLDEVTGNRLTQQFQYRQGYYDGHEREFRGFGLVLQTDAESAVSDPKIPFSAALLSKTWFHTGRHPQMPTDDYCTCDPQAIALGAHLLSLYRGDTETDETISDADEQTLREMARALSGSILRIEVYGLDDDPRNEVPFSVQQVRYRVRQLQPYTPYQRYAVMFASELETIDYQYERIADDPRCDHQLMLRRDAFGNLVHGVIAHYARRKTRADTPPFEDEYEQTWWRDTFDPAQQQVRLVETLSEAINLQDPQGWRPGLPYRRRSNALEFAKNELPPAALSYEGLIDPQGPLKPAKPRTLLALSRQSYIGKPVGEANFEALSGPVQSAELDETVMQAYDAVLSRAELENRLIDLGYQQMPAFLPEDDTTVLWAVQQNFATYAGLTGFYKIQSLKPTRSHGPTSITYDAYGCLPLSVTEPSGDKTQAIHDYRALQAIHITDPNGTVQEARYDAFGQLIASSVHGTEQGEAAGFAPLIDYQRPFDSPTLAVEHPEQALQDAAIACFYDAFSWAERKEPVLTAVLQADRYPDDPERQIRIGLSCFDGFGRLLQNKHRVDPGAAYVVDPLGALRLQKGQPVQVSNAPRWRVSERVEYNHKGLPVRVYRPYFADQYRYIDDVSFREFGYSDQQFYDPLGRPTQTLTAKGHLRRQRYFAWYSVNEDENDTAEEVARHRENPAMESN